MDKNEINNNQGQVNIANDNATIDAEQNRNCTKYDLKNSHNTNCSIGDNATVYNGEINKNNIDFKFLREELVKLRSLIEAKENLCDEENIILDDVSELISYTRRNDQNKIIEKLKNVGTKLKPHALSIGLSYLAGLIPQITQVL